MFAYDYKNQCWIEGEPARELLQKQLSDEIALLRSIDGDAYARMIGSRKDELLRLKESELESITAPIALKPTGIYQEPTGIKY